jgi:eukaryotic-like serine/threonine-protein kinase
MIFSRRLGPYNVLRPLGDTARSHAWLARHEHTGHEFALKLAPLADAAACARLRNEAAIGKLLDHPNILKVVEAGADDGVEWLALELASPRPATWPLAGFRQLLEALVHLQERGVVHCDVKPANLLQGADGRLVLADFGIARLLGQGAGAAHGSPGYMAPEQMRGAPLGGGVDLYAAGVVLYQLLTGQRPFAGTPFEVMQQTLRETAPAPSLVAGSDPRFDHVVARALAMKNADRYGSALALLRDFDAAFIP